MISDLLFALRFLTIVPVKGRHEEAAKAEGAVIYFPVAGLMIGAVLAGADTLLSHSGLGQLSVNTMLVILLALITGGLHLDGLADTFDALSGGRTRDEMLKIMRDPHIGTMGAASLFLAAMSMVALLSGIDPNLKGKALILMCVLSRWAMAFVMMVFPYAREDGKARIFFRNMDLKKFALASLIAAFLAVILWQLKGLLILAEAALAAYITGRFISKRIGGMTGDTLGAVNEIAAIVVLVGACAKY